MQKVQKYQMQVTPEFEMEKVGKFLKRFHDYEKVDDVFTNGCCYWFSIILFHRFRDAGAEIMYDEVMNHFGTCVNGRIFDVTGDVTNKYNWIRWVDLDDQLLVARITRDCIMF